LERGEQAARQLAAELLHLGAQRLRLLLDRRALALPLRERVLVARVELAEGLALGGEALLRLLVAFHAGESLLLEPLDRALDGVDLLQQRRVLALCADEADLLLVVLELLVGVLDRRLRLAAVVRRLLGGLADGGDL